MAMALQFPVIINLLIYLFFILLLLSSLVTCPSFMSISTQALELWQFSFTRDWLDIQKLETHPSEFCPISGSWGKLEIPNLAWMSLTKMLLNAAKCQGYSFYHFWVITGKPIKKGCKITPCLAQIRLKLFADDTSLFSVVDDIDEFASKLNNDLIRIQEWSFQTKMSFNP